MSEVTIIGLHSFETVATTFGEFGAICNARYGMEPCITGQTTKD